MKRKAKAQPSATRNRLPSAVVDSARLPLPARQTGRCDLLVAEPVHGIFELLLLRGMRRVHRRQNSERQKSKCKRQNAKLVYAEQSGSNLVGALLRIQVS